MVKISTRKVRSMRRELYKSEQDTKSIQKKTLVVVDMLTKKLAIEKQTSSILRGSLRNFSGPFYKLQHKYNKLSHAYAHKTKENDHLKRGILQLDAVRKRKNCKTRYINI